MNLLDRIQQFFQGLPEHLRDNKWLAIGMVAVYGLLLVFGVPEEAAAGAVLGLGPLVLYFLSAQDTKTARQKPPKDTRKRWHE